MFYSGNTKIKIPLSTFSLLISTSQAVIKMPPRIIIPLPSHSSARSVRCLSNTASCFYSPRKLKSKSKSKSAAVPATPIGQIPPESPKYIAIPQSRQIERVNRPWIKGVLPIPRKIFPRSLKKDKTSPEYIQATTPTPKVLVKPLPKDLSVAEYITYKAKQATARRRNLREGITELYNRKQLMDHEVATRSAAKQAQNRRLLYAPARDDEQFTATSVPHAIQPSIHRGLPDPNREERVAEMRRRTQAQLAAKREERLNMLHTLYMNARDFITTEAELEKLVDNVFDDQEQFSTAYTTGENIWNLGHPETVKTLLGIQERTGPQTAIDRAEGYGTVTRKRLNRIAEELTGGKMDIAE